MNPTRISLEGTIDFPAYWLAGKCHFGLNRFWKLTLVCTGLSLFGLGIFVAQKGVQQGYFLGIGGLLVTLYVPLLRLLHYRSWRKQPTLGKPFQMELTEDGIKTRSSFGNSDLKWAIFTKWKESPDVFLLYFAPNLYVVLPKKLITASSSVEVMRAMIANKVRKS